MIHEPGCPHSRLGIHRATKHGCRCPAVAAAVLQYRRAAKARQAARQGGRLPSDVDELDVEAAIITYASRGVPVPASMTKAERRLIAEWLERRNTDAKTVGHVTGITARSVVRRRSQARERVPV